MDPSSSWSPHKVFFSKKYSLSSLSLSSISLCLLFSLSLSTSLSLSVSPSAVIVYLENIGFIYPAMSMMVIVPSLLYKDKVSGVCCMMFIDSKWWCWILEQVQRVLEGVAGSKYLNTVQDQNCSFLFRSINKQRINENENKANNRTKNKINERFITNKEHE
jgi:hypothetical protein